MVIECSRQEQNEAASPKDRRRGVRSRREQSIEAGKARHSGLPVAIGKSRKGALKFGVCFAREIDAANLYDRSAD